MACVAPRLHGGDAGCSPPRRPTRPVPAQCQSSMLCIEKENGMLNSLMGETVRPLPHACEWDEIPEAFKAHIYPRHELDMKAMQDNKYVRAWEEVIAVGAQLFAGAAKIPPLLWRCYDRDEKELLREAIPFPNFTSSVSILTMPKRPHTTFLQTNPHMNDSLRCEQLAQDLARENNNESSGEEEEDEQRTGGDDDYSDDYDDDE
ncbi:hypothetical protein Tco_1184563 [Tanacetum coccineum]